VNGSTNKKVYREGYAKGKFSIYTQDVCLEKGEYELTIYDKFGNGLSSFHSEGYKLTVGEKVIAQGRDFEYSETTIFSIPMTGDQHSTSTILPAPEPTPFPILSPSSATPTRLPTKEQLLSSEDTITTPTSLFSPSSSRPTACQLVEVSISFNEDPVGSGWVLSQLSQTSSGEDGDDTVKYIEYFFPPDTSLANDSDVQSFCFEEGTYMIGVYDGSGRNGVDTLFIKVNGKIIVDVRDFEFSDKTVFDILPSPP